TRPPAKDDVKPSARQALRLETDQDGDDPLRAASGTGGVWCWRWRLHVAVARSLRCPDVDGEARATFREHGRVRRTVRHGEVDPLDVVELPRHRLRSALRLRFETPV